MKAIFFDLDDTLYPEREFVMSGFKAVAEYLAKKYNLKQLNIFNILKSDFEKGVREINFNLLLEKLKLPHKEVKKIVAIYHNHEPKIKLYPDAKEILKYFAQDKKIKIGIISDGLLNVQKNKINALKIDKIFDTIILSDYFGKKYRKPHTKPFEVACKKLKIKTEEAVYVADNPQKDFIGARKIGLFTIRIKRKDGVYSHIKETKKNKADLTIVNLSKIKDLC